MRDATRDAKYFGFVIALSLLLLAPSIWASMEAKDRGDWHVHNQSDYQVIVSIKTAAGANCLNSYVDSKQTLGLPADLHKCPYPVVVTVEAMQDEQTGSCEVTVEKMHDITFTGDKCE